jgi:trk system potassium uptake protein TrkH
MIALGFFICIIAGTLLLMLPVSQAEGQQMTGWDALFTATTSVCVTGLVTVTTAEAWSLFGKLVILFLIQIGGLGVVTFTTILLVVLGKRVTLKERLMLQDAYNLDTLSGLVRLTKRILKFTLAVEGIGAVFYAIVLIPEYGFFYGLFASVFNAVSAFCNAGMDILGSDSLISYRTDALMNVTTMLLIVAGGLGFPVWWDIMGTLEEIRKDDGTQIYHRKRRYLPAVFFEKLELHSKLVLSLTSALIFLGMVFTLLLEWDNPATLAGLSIPQKFLAALFQSVTTRTAGFLTIPQENFRDATSVIYLIMMFIGGSPCGTAGGVKTVTVYMMVLAAVSTIKGRNYVEVFHRRIDESSIKKGMAVILFSMTALFLSIIALSLVQRADFMDILYECTSAIATVGLSRSLTPGLTVAGKLVIIITMYAGRIGPISLALFFNSKKGKEHQVKYPQGKIYIG